MTTSWEFGASWRASLGPSRCLWRCGAMLRRAVGATCVTLLCLVATPVAFGGTPVARAQDESSNVDSQDFRAVEGAAEEEISGLGLMFAGYAVAWSLLLLFVLRLGLLHRGTVRELESVKQALAARSSDSDSASN